MADALAQAIPAETGGGNGSNQYRRATLGDETQSCSVPARLEDYAARLAGDDVATPAGGPYTARERALGRMIIAARGAGDLVDHGGDRRSTSSATRLNDLGVSYDLASDAVVFADLPDDVWDKAVWFPLPHSDSAYFVSRVEVWT